MIDNQGSCTRRQQIPAYATKDPVVALEEKDLAAKIRLQANCNKDKDFVEFIKAADSIGEEEDDPHFNKRVAEIMNVQPSTIVNIKKRLRRAADKWTE